MQELAAWLPVESYFGYQLAKFMKIKFAFVRAAPVTRLRKISWKRRLLAESYGRDIREARTASDHDRVEMLKRDHGYEVDMLGEEEAVIRTRAIVAKARKYEVILPMRVGIGGQETDDWEQGHYMGEWALTDIGRAKVRDGIRTERKALHDDRMRWIVWIAPLTGLIGVITGLVALLKK